MLWKVPSWRGETCLAKSPYRPKKLCREVRSTAFTASVTRPVREEVLFRSSYQVRGLLGTTAQLIDDTAEELPDIDVLTRSKGASAIQPMAVEGAMIVDDVEIRVCIDTRACRYIALEEEGCEDWVYDLGKPWGD